jgi:hypothetical protein
MSFLPGQICTKDQQTTSQIPECDESVTEQNCRSGKKRLILNQKNIFVETNG